MAELLTEITKENYEQEVVASELPVLLDFWGPKCVPCLGLMPTVEELAAAYSGKVKFCKINTAANRRMAIQLKVMSLPTFQFYKDGAVVAELQGEFGREEIEAQLNALLGE